MTLRDDLDHEKLAEAALAILSLSSWGEEYEARAWKGLDWDLMDLLHEKGWIRDPVGTQKSVVLTEQGVTLAATYLEKHFGK
ncbi:MAG: DUF6429 family protein [Halioglobus sp.]